MSEKPKEVYGLVNFREPEQLSGPPREFILLTPEDVGGIRTLSEARRAAMSMRETDLASHAAWDHIIGLAERNFAKADLDLKLERKEYPSWTAFGRALFDAFFPFGLNQTPTPKRLGVMQQTLADMYDFLMYAYDQSASSEIYGISMAFESMPRNCPDFFDLLPEKAFRVKEDIERFRDATHEEWLRQQDQMGY